MASQSGPFVVQHASSNVGDEGTGVFAEISTSAIPALSRVRLYEETVEHASAHEDVPAHLPSIIGAVGNAVQNPSHVEKTNDSSYVFVDVGTTNDTGHALRVPVKVLDGTGSGRIRTFHWGDLNDGTVVYRREKPGE